MVDQEVRGEGAVEFRDGISGSDGQSSPDSTVLWVVHPNSFEYG